jgi:hypothetical protein
MNNHPSYKAPRAIEERLLLPCRSISIYAPGAQESAPNIQRFLWAGEASGPGKLNHVRGHGTFTYRFDENPEVQSVIKNVLSSGLPLTDLVSQDHWAVWDYEKNEPKSFIIWDYSVIHLRTQPLREPLDLNYLK